MGGKSGYCGDFCWVRRDCRLRWKKSGGKESRDLNLFDIFR